MKRQIIAGLIVATLMAGGAASSLLAQNGPGQGRGQGRGYGGPPQSEEERAARQADCQQKNGGICPNGGPRQDCQGQGWGKGNGAGNGARKGLRDGTGPRSADGTCPQQPARKGQR